MKFAKKIVKNNEICYNIIRVLIYGGKNYV